MRAVEVWLSHAQITVVLLIVLGTMAAMVLIATRFGPTLARCPSRTSAPMEMLAQANGLVSHPLSNVARKGVGVLEVSLGAHELGT